MSVLRPGRREIASGLMRRKDLLGLSEAGLLQTCDELSSLILRRHDQGIHRKRRLESQGETLLEERWEHGSREHEHNKL